jgi:pre-mRNA-splicing factor ATP-dependent RNA helicase DHX15/PRP43
LQTPKNYLRTVTAIQPEWLLDIAPHSFDDMPEGEAKRALQRITETSAKTHARRP